MGLFDLTGHVAVVTGGNGGLGFGIAQGLARAGADVSIWGRDAARNAEAASRLAAHGTAVHHVRCDVTSEDDVAHAFARTVAVLGRVDSCFANAGALQRPSSFVDLELDEFRRVMAVNLDGAFLTLRGAAAQMLKQGGGGSLVGVSSTASRYGGAKGQAYPASKAALNSLVRGIAVELAPQGIRANALLPGWSASPMTDELLATRGMQQKVLTRIPARRWGAAEDLEGAAVYLASGASAFQTGSELVVDGGYTVY
jgi:NAD(P)-dependent dehydrogenase (short-subunit alcohol dehydrogenase family)